MIPTQEILFNLLLNSLVQISFFAIVAAFFASAVAKARAKHQYTFYLAALLFCLAAPVINTLWHTPSAPAAEKSRLYLSTPAGGANHFLWSWEDHLSQRKHSLITTRLQLWIVGAWGVLVLLRLGRFSRAVHRVRRLRREAFPLSPAQIGTAGHVIEARHHVALLESAAIDDPVTIGVFHPAIAIPSRVLPQLGEAELSAILAHEYGHIRRGDFLVHILCELVSLPVAWHPGIRYLMSKISQTRELACDDYAAARLGKRRSYAHTLLHLASLCMPASRGNVVALGIFDGDNLEARIMMLTKKTRSLSQAGVIVLALTATITFGAGAVLARAVSLQSTSAASSTAQKFAGTWHWMFEGKSFSTMILVWNGSGITGSVTPSEIALKDDGSLLRADPSDNSAPVQIVKAELEGSALHVTVMDGQEPFEFVVTMKDDTHAEIQPVGAPPNMKPIAAEKAN